MSPTTVVVVEDSPTQRQMIVRAIEEDHRATVVAEAESAQQAVAAVARCHPDVVTLDLEIPGAAGRGPGAGGLQAIREIMAGHPTPILVLSAHADRRDSVCTVLALAAGATDAIPKPHSWTTEDRLTLRRRVHTLRGVAVVRRRREPRLTAGARVAVGAPHPSPPPAVPSPLAPPTPGSVNGSASSPPRPIIGLVASTGGPLALRRVLGDLAGVDAPVLVVQHLHREFSEGFARWLSETTGMPVELLEHPERPLPGHVYVAPGGRHLRLGGDGRIVLGESPELLHRPSGDELLRSLADNAGAGSVAAVLTGMGDDGAAGLRAIAERGGACFAQDAESCAVFGMPRAATQLGAVRQTTPLASIGAELMRAVARRRVR